MLQENPAPDATGVIRAVLAIAPGFNPSAKVVPATVTQPSTALMLAPKAQVTITLEYWLASLVATLHGKGRGGRHLALVNEVRSRIYREGGVAKIFPITWEPARYENGVGAEAEVSVNADGKTVQVRVCPAFETGIQYERITNDGERFVTAGSYHCILLCPQENRRDQDTWTAVEIGLGRASDLEEFNKLSLADPIPCLPHTLLKLGQRRIVWTPPTYKLQSFGQKRSGKGEKEPEKRTVLGYMGGKIVFLDEHSEFPDFIRGPNGADGKPQMTGFKAGVFSVTEGPRSVTLRYLGKPGNVALEDGIVPEFSQIPDFDPWAILGRSPSRLDYKQLQKVQARLTETLADPANPAVAYARALGIVREGAELELIQKVVGPMIRTAVERAREELGSAWTSLSNSVDTIATSLVLAEIVGDQDVQIVERRRGGTDDLAAQNVSAAIGSPFDWQCPMHRELRSRLIEALKAKEPKPEPVVAAETEKAPDEAVSDEQPAEGASDSSDPAPGDAESAGT